MTHIDVITKIVAYMFKWIHRGGRLWSKSWRMWVTHEKRAHSMWECWGIQKPKVGQASLRGKQWIWFWLYWVNDDQGREMEYSTGSWSFRIVTLGKGQDWRFWNLENFSQPRERFCPWRHVAVLGCLSWGGCYWHIVNRGQRSC